jgi:replicative DNA helicase
VRDSVDADVRALPHSLDAERSVLGAVLLDNRMLPVAQGVGLEASFFFRAWHQRVFEHMTLLDQRSVAIDFLTLRESMGLAGVLGEHGATDLAGLVDGVPRATNVEHYARIVVEKATLRKLLSAARQIVDDAYSTDETGEIVSRAEARLLTVGTGRSGGGFVPASEWMRAAASNIERNANDPRTVTGVPSGFAALDAMTRGFQPSNFVIIGARTGVGKTAMGLQMCLHGSLTHVSAFLSMEMSRDELGYRAVAAESGVDAFRLQTGNLSGFEASLVGRAAADIGNRRLVISDAPQNIHAVCSDIRRLVATEGLQIAWLDYVGLIEGPKAENRTQVVSAISRRLKALAMELNITVAVLCQLSREAVKGNERPQLHHLKESGSLEQDANVVLLLHRPDMGEDGGPPKEGEPAVVYLAKNRSGRRGVVHLSYRGSLTKFVEQSDAPAAPVQGRLA